MVRIRLTSHNARLRYRIPDNDGISVDVILERPRRIRTRPGELGSSVAVGGYTRRDRRPAARRGEDSGDCECYKHDNKPTISVSRSRRAIGYPRQRRDAFGSNHSLTLLQYGNGHARPQRPGFALSSESHRRNEGSRMLTITLQDLRFRARQFVIAVIGAGLVFAMTLLLAGLAQGFKVEINQTVEGMGAQSWVLPTGSVARIASLPPILESAVSAVAQSPGITRAEPLIVVPQAAEIVGRQAQSVNLIGYQPGQSLGGPGAPITGRPLAGNGQAVIDARLGLGIGRSFTVSGHIFQVVGVVRDRTLLGGEPNAYVTLNDAQRVIFGGRPLIGAVLITGSARSLPAGYSVISNTQVEAASLAQLSSAVSSISKFARLHVVDRRAYRRRPRIRDRAGAHARFRGAQSRGSVDSITLCRSRGAGCHRCPCRRHCRRCAFEFHDRNIRPTG